MRKMGDATEPTRKQPDRLDVWFCWTSGLAAAALVALCLAEAIKAEPIDRASPAPELSRVVG